MISGNKTARLLIALALTCWSNAWASDPAALVRGLARPAPARTAFAEARFMNVLDRPLVVSGELAWLGGDTLERRVDAPHPETATIADGEVTQQRQGKRPRSFSIRHAPQLAVLVDSFVALLGGDASRLGQSFDVRAEGDAAAAWSLTLVPRDARLAKTVASIRIDGHGNQPRCMQMQEADGDLAVDLLGPLATQMPPTPTRDGLLALCRGS